MSEQFPTQSPSESPSTNLNPIGTELQSQSEILLAPSVSPDGHWQMRVATVDGSLPYNANEEAAAIIEAELAATGVQDDEAQVIALLYRNQPIPADLLPGLNNLTYTGDTPGLVLRSAVYDQLNEQEQRSSRSQLLTAILRGDNNGPASGNIWFINSDGLSIDTLRSADLEWPHLDEPNATLGEDSPFASLIYELHINQVGFQSELVYGEPDAYGTTPNLLSQREHYALGRLSVAGEFEHVATALDSRHPVMTLQRSA